MSVGKAYLVVYNALQVAGWSAILYKTSLGLSQGLRPNELYKAVSWELSIFQTAAVLEVVHAMVGLVRSPVATTAVQVASRIVITWPVVYKVPAAQATVGIPMILMAWSVTEVIRYSFYGLGLLNAVPFVLTWLRYTLFIGLYPLGVSGELLCVWSALPAIKRNKVLYYELPNRLNISFDFWVMLIAFVLCYIPAFPQLYFYMFGQRKKVLAAAPKEKAQ